MCPRVVSVSTLSCPCNIAYTYARCVTCYFKDLRKTRKTHNWGFDHSFLNLDKCFSSNVKSCKLIFLYIVHNRGHNSVEPFYIPSVKGSKSVETSHHTDDLWFQPILDGSLFRIRRNSVQDITNPENELVLQERHTSSG